MITRRIFLLSPAHCGGKRAAILVRADAGFALAKRLRTPAGAPLGEVFSFLSGLYFRGKLAYGTHFADPPPGMPGTVVITTNRGLVEPATPVSVSDLDDFGSVPIHPGDARYRDPLVADVGELAGRTDGGSRFVLLGSIATQKYIEILLDLLGDRLLFPEPFIGMGDMQRGALLLRAAASGSELPYVVASRAVRSLTAARRSAGRVRRSG
jgi:hypothetical protein